MANQLQLESSPYLLQHANNPVNWYPYNSQALDLAKKLDKPILLSIGYSACHWCHVMERESFENKLTADLMNANFINIKVDREERPDIDHIYMAAVQAMTGSGGWPLNVFLTPDLKPFYGGTYFPPMPAHNRPSWNHVLVSIADAYKNRKNEIIEQGNAIYDWLQETTHPQKSKGSNDPKLFDEEALNRLFEQLHLRFDSINGGFEKAPKFLGTMNIRLLLQHFYFTANTKSLAHIELSLEKMLNGGIYDHVGGGISRYSTDEKWLVPHFEKMLYDQALLLIALAETFQLTQKPLYNNAIADIIGYLEREMITNEGAFYSAEDADSEGVEGKYYVWTKKEIDNVLGNWSPLFCTYYNITLEGNWAEGASHASSLEGINILHITKTESEICEQFNLNTDEFRTIIKQCHRLLLRERLTRVHPLLDDKILLGWNALCNEALSKCFQATGNKKYLDLALKNMEWLEEKFHINNVWLHTYKNGESKLFAFLDDLSYLLAAYLQLYESTFDESFLTKADKLAKYIVINYGTEEEELFYFTSKDQNDLLIRKLEMYDGALPSGNSVMCLAFQRLGKHLNNKEYTDRAVKMVNKIYSGILQHPSSFAYWAMAFINEVKGFVEVAVTGSEAFDFAHQISAKYIPNKIIEASTTGSDLPLLTQKKYSKDTLIYKCENYSCQKPVNTLEEFLKSF